MFDVVAIPAENLQVAHAFGAQPLVVAMMHFQAVFRAAAVAPATGDLQLLFASTEPHCATHVDFVVGTNLAGLTARSHPVFAFAPESIRAERVVVALFLFVLTIPIAI